MTTYIIKDESGSEVRRLRADAIETVGNSVAFYFVTGCSSSAPRHIVAVQALMPGWFVESQ